MPAYRVDGVQLANTTQALVQLPWSRNLLRQPFEEEAERLPRTSLKNAFGSTWLPCQTPFAATVGTSMRAVASPFFSTAASAPSMTAAHSSSAPDFISKLTIIPRCLTGFVPFPGRLMYLTRSRSMAGRRCGPQPSNRAPTALRCGQLRSGFASL